MRQGEEAAWCIMLCPYSVHRLRRGPGGLLHEKEDHEAGSKVQPLCKSMIITIVRRLSHGT